MRRNTQPLHSQWLQAHFPAQFDTTPSPKWEKNAIMSLQGGLLPGHFPELQQYKHHLIRFLVVKGEHKCPLGIESCRKWEMCSIKCVRKQLIGRLIACFCGKSSTQPWPGLFLSRGTEHCNLFKDKKDTKPSSTNSRTKINSGICLLCDPRAGE